MERNIIWGSTRFFFKLSYKQCISLSFLLLSIFATHTQCKDKSCKIWMQFFSVGITSNTWRFPITVSWKPQTFGNCFDSRLCAMLIDSSVSICFPRIVHSSSFEKFILLFLIISPDALTTFVISVISIYFYLCVFKKIRN